jgi:hypothetical protein
MPGMRHDEHQRRPLPPQVNGVVMKFQPPPESKRCTNPRWRLYVFKASSPPRRRARRPTCMHAHLPAHQHACPPPLLPHPPLPSNASTLKN